MNFSNPFQKKNEIWKYNYRSHEIMITMKRSNAKASKVTLYINGEKVNEGLMRLHASMEGSLPSGETVFIRMESGLDNIECHVIIGRKLPLEKHGKDISDDEVATFAAMGMLSTEFQKLPEK
ncbi:MAG: hypothetical protein IJ644_09075 [Oscillospiraceae bacterium]|nr:hypothetical protein [Oscillospiraceae bacterium]